MNSIHDCGGMQGLGKLYHSSGGAVFNQRWEGRVAAMTYAVYSARNVEIKVGFRPPIESIPAVDYLRMSYFEIWLTALTERMTGSALITDAELKSGHSLAVTTKDAIPASPAQAVKSLYTVDPDDDRKPDTTRPKFRVGAHVRARNINPLTHTRLPRYARGKVGTIVRSHGTFNFPDTDEYDLGANPNPAYSVRFAARELWGPAASAKDFVYVDLWEKYIEPA